MGDVARAGTDGVTPVLPVSPRGRISLSLLSGFELRRDDRALAVAPSAQRVLAFLALHRRRLSRIFVAGHLWTDVSEPRATAALRTALWRVGAADSRLVRSEGHALCLDPAVEIDVADCAGLARHVLDGDDVALGSAALAGLRDAGELLPDWYDDWVLIERERVRQLRLHALERLCLALSADARHAEATEAGIAAVASDPLRESAHRALIAAHLAEGNCGEALRQYDSCRTLLRRDLGVAPSAALDALVAHLRAASGARAVTPR
jgi:DNA-binding SARP family transcriptional activator